MAAGRNLQLLPRRGRVVLEVRNENCREIFIYGYRLIYSIEGHAVRIVAVIHGRRLLGPIAPRLPQ